MKYNDREIAKIGENKADLEGVLFHMKRQGNDWSDWYQRPSFKERYFKLISNLLFYYRVSEQEPLGILVIENAQVAYEKPHRGVPFAFSVTFRVNDRFRDDESKHIFSCRCDSDVSKWVAALKISSYEYWRSQYTILKTKISMKTGKDPVLEYMQSKNCSSISEKRVEIKKTKTKENKSTFYSHVETSTFYESTYSSKKVVSNSGTEIEVENLIKL